MIRDEDGALTGYVYVDLNTRDYGGFVNHANDLLRQKMKLPAGYTYQWSGEYEFELRAKERLKLILPVVFFMIFLLLYLIFKSVTEAMVLIFPTVYAMTGGLLLQWLLGYNFSVAVWVGYIALFGTAIQTGVVMVVYLEEMVAKKRLERGTAFARADLIQAIKDGARLRLRPKVMTVATVVASLLPIMWSVRTGAEVMKPLAAPVIGGMLSSLIHILIVTPVIFAWLRERELRKELAARV